jgi:hypothetical protein
MSHEETISTFVIQFILVIALVPVVAILAPFTAGIIKMILSHRERKAKIHAEANAQGNELLRNEIEGLRQDLAQLRDTTTQYDVSIQHTLEELQQRVSHLETRGKPSASVETDQDTRQTMNAGNFQG